MNIVLGITGSIAACKAPEIISHLKKANYNIKVVLTKQGAKFVTPLTCQALLGSEVYLDFESETSPDQMDHISIAKWCDILLIAPASANIIAKMANGISDDLLSTIYLATKAKTFIAPAMNTNMWEHSVVKNNVSKLEKQNVIILGPCHGLLACNTEGLGRMIDSCEIMKKISPKKTNIKVLITVGCTQEKIDPIRHLSNNSSGKMGLAIVNELITKGVDVTCVLGPCNQTLPFGAKYIKVISAHEMYEACMNELQNNMHIFIGCAAVANYTPTSYSNVKLKSSNDLKIKFNKTKDILKSIATNSKRPKIVVGFAAETENLVKNAKEKLNNKKCDIIIANLITEKTGMQSDINEISIIDANSIINLELNKKTILAKDIASIILNKEKQKSLQTT